MRILVALLCLLAFVRGATTEFEARRIESQNTALTLYPEVADPLSRIGAEVERLLAEYEAAKDIVLARDDAPLVITQRAAERVAGLITPEESEKDALRLFPDLALEDSPLKKLFVERREAMNKGGNPAVFKNPRWPLLLAFDCAVTLDPARRPGAAPAAQTPPPERPTPVANPAAQNPPAPAGVAGPPIPTPGPTPVAAPPQPTPAAVPASPPESAATPAVPKTPRVRRPSLIGADSPPPTPAVPPTPALTENNPPTQDEKPPTLPESPDPASTPAVPKTGPPPSANPAPPPASQASPAIQQIDPSPITASSHKPDKNSWSNSKTQIGRYLTVALALASLIVGAAAWVKNRRV